MNAPGKESLEKLIQQVHLLVQDYSNEPTALREAIRLQNLLVFAVSCTRCSKSPCRASA
ncbi:hypothetical protein EMIT0P253_70164 [Pseudomonas sp. IT-P253]|jgi:hypothetical protein|uniref:hypothetical protein n=1 Tax=Pseudomonas sp. IT-P253 TaxID=3026455 RepID=UPI0039E02820